MFKRLILAAAAVATLGTSVAAMAQDGEIRHDRQELRHDRHMLRHDRRDDRNHGRYFHHGRYWQHRYRHNHRWMYR